MQQKQMELMSMFGGMNPMMMGGGGSCNEGVLSSMIPALQQILGDEKIAIN